MTKKKSQVKKTVKKAVVTKKTPSKKEAVVEPLYVGVSNPTAIHKELLETSKSHIVMLQRYEKVKGIRKEKEKRISEFAKLASEIKSEIVTLQRVLPNHELTAKLVMAPVKKAVKKAQVAVHGKPSKEIEKLAFELSEIESKLSRL